MVLLVGSLLGGQTGLVIALVIALGMNGYAYFNSDKLALRAMHARAGDEAEQPAIVRIVRELANAAHQPMPGSTSARPARPTPSPTGRNPRNAAVCATTGSSSCWTSGSCVACSGTSSARLQRTS